ncbi:MAG: PGPGW domain-containing protein [Planctomycetota bacterium]|jgi:hypothetical protein
MFVWIQSHKTLLGWLAATSVVTFVFTLIAIPWLVVRIPADYFAGDKPSRTPWANQHPIVRALLLAAKNLLGYVFIVAGVLMLVLPGQGLLTIVIGVLLLDFPGKYRFERWLVSRRPVIQSINWLRRRRGREPLVLDS